MNGKKPSRLEANDKFYRELLKHYTVTVENPEPRSKERSQRQRSEMKRALFIFVLLVTLAPSLSAHEVRPAYLELRQTGPETYDALWKVPGQGDLRLGLYVELPANCTNVTEPSGSMANNAYTERWTVKCPGGLSGGTIHIAGLSATVVDVLVRLERLDGSYGSNAAHAIFSVVCSRCRSERGGRRPHVHGARHRAHPDGR